MGISRGSIFGQRGTDAKPFATNGRCPGSGSEGTSLRCPVCLRTIRRFPNGKLQTHTP